MSTQKKSSKPGKVTTRTVVDMKGDGEKISMITAYDYTMARLVDMSGIDIVLIGDSASNVMAGNETTLPITLDQMIYHSQCVIKGINRALVVADLPFMSYQVTPKEALKSAGRMMKEAGVHALKLEGGTAVVDTVKKIVDAGIPVMGHLGLTPQSIYKFGTYKVRATETDEADILLEDAKKLEEAGCFGIVLEKIPSKLAQKVTESLSIPTIGIGAGVHCDGQVLVLHDMLGLNKDFNPRFVRRYADLQTTITGAVGNYINDIKEENFPSKEESYD
ncbi:MAG TPA: 3-methyl-2-oxobutanoate hydroxymethyltransferase [Balneolales bacterium]|nr:3-methyl-2-oxobutanoate hydroxymethyltransferase [Balneolales bacterium]